MHKLSVFAAAAFTASMSVAFAACFIENPNAKPAPTATDAAADTGAQQLEAGASICARYGGYATAEKLTQAAVSAVVADCRIGHFFAATLQDKEGKRAPHLVDCLTKQVAVILGCEGIRYDVDNAGARCLGMRESHRELSIRNQDMDVFVEDLVTVLQSAGVAQADIDAIAPGILALRGDIVTNSAPGNGKSICEAGAARPDTGIPDTGIQDTGIDSADAGGDR